MPDQDIIGATDLVSTSGDYIAVRTDAPETPRGHVLITMTPELSLVMADKDPNAPFLFVQTHQGETYLAVEQDSIIQISLDDKFDWEFDKLKGLLSFKNGNHRPFYRIQYRPTQSPLRDLVLHAKATGEPQTNPQTHLFDLHLIIKQKSPTGVVGRSLPLTIDPIVKNPPTGNGMYPKDLVPLLSASA